jgi:hypothetical protein
MTDQIPFLAISDRQDLYSMAFVKAIVAAAGFNITLPALDRDSTDLNVEFSDIRDITPKYNRLVIQVKCTYQDSIDNNGILHFALPKKNYNDLIGGINPKILVVVHVPEPNQNQCLTWIQYNVDHVIFRNKAYWICITGFEPTSNKSKITISIPTTNIFDIQTLTGLMEKIARGIKKL